jgi:hypothetical protein
VTEQHRKDAGTFTESETVVKIPPAPAAQMDADELVTETLKQIRRHLEERVQQLENDIINISDVLGDLRKRVAMLERNVPPVRF